MDGIDWLSLCRRMVAAQQQIFARYGTAAERTEYEGIGSGGDRTLVIDRLCEDAAFAELEALVAGGGPPLRVVSEERGEVTLTADSAAPYAGGATVGIEDEHSRAESIWVVIDPIDGSLNARRTIPHHSFCLAVASGPEMKDVEFGFVHDFGTSEEFVARRGEGAWLNGAPLDLSARTSSAGRSDRPERLEVIGLESADPDLAAPVMAALAGRAHRLRVVGSIAITLCQVAAGRFDGMFSLRPCRSVDVAAAQLVVSAAGGRVSLGPDGESGARFGLDKRFPIVAARTGEGLSVLRAAQDKSPGFG